MNAIAGRDFNAGSGRIPINTELCNTYLDSKKTKNMRRYD